MERKHEDKPPEESEQSDEELLKEAEWAKKQVPDNAVPEASQEEFEETWRRIREEHEG